MFFPLKAKHNGYNRTLAGRQAVAESSELFKPTKLNKPSNPNDAVEGVPNVIFSTGDVASMSDTEGFSLSGGVIPDAVVPDNPPSIDPAGTEETVIHVWSAVSVQSKRCRTTKKGGPNWNDVVMRITRDAVSGEEIERLENASAILSKEIVPSRPRWPA